MSHETSNRLPCKYCQDGHATDAGGYYEEKSCHRKAIWALMMTETDTTKRKKLQSAYELACYVGD